MSADPFALNGREKTAGTERPGSPGVFRVGTAGGSSTILLVDDEETVRAIAAKILRSSGYEVVQARDGVEALDLFRRRAPAFNLVLLDLTMPKMDGELTLQALRNEDGGVRIILMSGYDEQATLERFAGRGVDGFVPKPFTAEVLLERVRKVVAASKD
jgi:two-component system, cell cycle sensor histidine kinase and response regulator CckA